MTAQLVADVAELADGSNVQLRPISDGDADRLVAFHEGLSPETVYLRFFTAHPHLSPPEVERFTHVDGNRRMAFVALDSSDIVGVARYERSQDDPACAEVAFVVTDRYQGRGLGGIFLRRLASHAVGAGIRTFSAVTMVENVSMQEVFRHSGFPFKGRYRNGLIECRLDISTV